MSSHASKTSSFGDIKVLYFLVAFRICNALLLQTFFQPDEYFQSLEPAWSTAFGESSGAWITWEWKQMLRSSLHPFFFAAVYRASDLLAHFLRLSPDTRSEILLAAPKIVQALFAAAGEYYTWKLARKTYGPTSRASTGALFLTICSPWQWFVSTRTLSNSIETTLTAVALYAWPFDASVDDSGKSNKSIFKQMQISFAFAALATILRPTNSLIWTVIACYTAVTASNFRVVRFTRALLYESSAALVSGSAVLVISIISDRFYYNDWTFPPLRFIHFNVVQSLAVFYGRNRPDYYITEGLPLLLTTSLPFVIIGVYNTLPSKRSLNNTTNKPSSSKSSPPLDPETTLQPLALTATVFIALMSTIAHKEVRFIYPLLPALNVLAASPFSKFFTPLPWPRATVKKMILAVLLAANISLAFYISQVHQRGVVDVTHFLRKEYEQKILLLHEPRLGGGLEGGLEGGGGGGENMTVLLLMPCHSTPWRSHLVYSGIEARALTCEPPVDIPFSEREGYMDEGDVFYADPKGWMEGNLVGVQSIGGLRNGEDGGKLETKVQWPQYLVFFEQLEETMMAFLEGTRYKECWRGFNTHWHDDGRRKGDVIVWSLS